MLTTVLKRLPSRTVTSCVSGSTTASPVLSKLIDSNVCSYDFHEQMHLRVFRRGMAKKAKKRGKWATKKKTSEYVKKALADAENYEKRFDGFEIAVADRDVLQGKGDVCVVGLGGLGLLKSRHCFM